VNLCPVPKSSLKSRSFLSSTLSRIAPLTTPRYRYAITEALFCLRYLNRGFISFVRSWKPWWKLLPHPSLLFSSKSCEIRLLVLGERFLMDILGGFELLLWAPWLTDGLYAGVMRFWAEFVNLFDALIDLLYMIDLRLVPRWALEYPEL